MDSNHLRETLNKFDPQNIEHISILEQLLKYVYEGSAADRKMATELLLEFENRPDSLFLTPQIIALSSNDETRFYMLSLLQKAIELKWKAIPSDQRPGIKSFVGQLAVQWSGMANTPKYMQTKANEALISIIKYEWPEYWPNLIQELVTLARGNELHCRNILRIFSSLAYEITNTWDITHSRGEELKSAALKDFDSIYKLCIFVFDAHLEGKVLDSELMMETFNCLQTFIPLIGYKPFHSNQCLQYISMHFFENKDYRRSALKFYITYLQNVPVRNCEPTSFRNEPNDHEIYFLIISQVLESLESTSPDTFMYHKSGKVPVNSRLYWEDYYFEMSRFLSHAVMNNLITWPRTTESEIPRGVVDKIDLALKYMLKLTDVAHDETCKVALDFWHKFVQFLNQEHKQMRSSVTNNVAHSMTELVKLLILNMCKPPEVYVKFDEETGTIVREWETDTAEVQAYNQMSFLLYTLAIIYPTNVEAVLYSESAKYTDKEEYRGDLSSWKWSPASFNRLCWAVGSISGAMSEEMEKKFLNKIIFKLLNLCEHRTGRGNKAIVASMTMYVVGKFPRFLKRLYRFMEAVIQKLFIFMDEDFPGVQQMAVETLLKLSRPLKKELSMVLRDGSVVSKSVPVGSSLTDVSIPVAIERITHMDETANVILLYEAIGVMNSGSTDAVRRMANYDIILQHPIRVIVEIKENSELLATSGIPRQQFALNLKVLSVICEHAGLDFAKYFDDMCDSLMEMYSVLSNFINSEIINKGTNSAGYENVKQLRVCKKEILVLLGCYIKSVSRDPTLRSQVSERYTKMVLFVLNDYEKCQTVAKDVEVLRFLKNIVENLEEAIIPYLPVMFQLVFHSTLDMISADFHTNMDHRVAFYELLMACTKNALEGVLRLPANELKLYVECLAFGFRHEQPTIADLGLAITQQFLSTIILRSMNNNNSDYHVLLKDFCNVLYKDMFRNILSVATDTLHKNGLLAQCEILRMLIFIVVDGLVDSPEPDLCEWVTGLVFLEFPNIPRESIRNYFSQLFANSSDPRAFGQIMGDLLIDSKRLHSEVQPAM